MDRDLKRSRVSVEDELQAYLDSPAAPADHDILLWWKLNRAAYPNLFKIAIDHLSISATSSPSERAFSAGRLILHYTRSSLHGETLSQLMMLRSWLKKLD
jgi:hypothetical protein